MEDKVLGIHADLAEVFAIRSLLECARKLEAVYDRVEFIIMSDYHTFDQYVGIPEENYLLYHQDLKDIIHQLGGEDVIKLISLSTFKEFKVCDGLVLIPLSQRRINKNHTNPLKGDFC